MKHPADPLALELRQAARRYGRRWALRGVTLQVARGEAVAVMGDNGSGKSTLLRVVATAVTLTSGDGRVFGHDLRRDGARIRPLVGLLGHAPGLYDDLTVRENVEFAARMLDLPDPADEISEALRITGLTPHSGERVRTLSSGWQRRVAIARLWMQRPQLLLLDEPYNSFDAGGIALVSGLVESVTGRGGAALVVTHTVPAGAGRLDRSVFLRGGVIHQPDIGSSTRAADASVLPLPGSRATAPQVSAGSA